MTETTNPTNTVETLEEELEGFEKGLREATSSAQRASKRLQAIESQKDVLSPGVFGGDTDATERYKALEEEGRVHSEMSQEMRHLDQDAANNMALSAMTSTRDFLRTYFARWLR